MRYDPLFVIGVLAALVVVAILMLGIGSFAKGGEFHKRNANRLMRWRIIAQALAVLAIVLFAWAKSRGS